MLSTSDDAERKHDAEIATMEGSSDVRRISSGGGNGWRLAVISFVGVAGGRTKKIPKK